MVTKQFERLVVCLSIEGQNSLTPPPPPSPPSPFTIVQSWGVQRLATPLDLLAQRVPPWVPDCHSGDLQDGWGGDLQLQPLAMVQLGGRMAETVSPPVCHSPSETLSAPAKTSEGEKNVKNWSGHLSPRVDIKEVVSAAFIACCLFTGSHSWCSRDPYSLLFVIPDANQGEQKITKKDKIPPVSVVELSSGRHLEDVADICVEHVEQNVVLVPIQLYRSKLFSYRCVCEVPA